MIIIFLIFIRVYCQLQLNPIDGQNFFYKIQDVSKTTGYTLQVLQPNLGFLIQGGFVAGGLNSTIQTQNVIGTSLYQKMNLIGLLELNSNYSVSTTAYNLSGYLNEQIYLFNVSSINQTCQNFEIIGYVNVILHCINTSSSQITIYFYNNSQLIQVNTGQTINNLNQLIQTTIQYYYEDGIYDLYFIYISQFQSFVLNSQLYNNTISQLQQIWSQPAQYIQIFVSFEQEVFALQFNYLLYQYNNYKQKFQSQNGSNWLSMNILYDEFDEFLIILVNNYTIYEIFFEYTFQIFSQQQLPVIISSAQIYSDVNYIFILTPKQTLVYQYEGDTFQSYQYSQYSIINQLNQYSSLSNIIINTNSSGIQLFQLLDYFLYNNQPSQSGFITIGMFNQNNQMIQNETIYINVLQSFQNQICPIYQNFNGISYQSNNSYYQQADISQFYIGSNLTYSINQTTLNGISILNQQINQEQNQQSQIGVYSISQFNALLKVQILDSHIDFLIVQYAILSQDVQSILESKFQLDITYLDMYFIEYENGTVMTLIATQNLIYAFQIDPLVGLISNYTINLTDTLKSSSFSIQQGVTKNNLLFILTTNKNLISIQIFTTYYIIQDFLNTEYYYMAGYQYEQYFLFFITQVSYIFYVDIYTWDNNQFYLFQTLQLAFVEDTNNLYGVSINPVANGIFICYDKSQIRFYDKSSFVETNIGKQQFYYQIDTTNITFMQNTQLNSLLYLYSLVKYNDNSYINIYQGTQILNSLYQSIYVNVTLANIDQFQISVTSDIINQCDYFAVVSNQEAYIYQIPYKFTVQQFPNNQYINQFNISSKINVSNLNNNQMFYLNFTIYQSNILINQIQNLPQISNNQTNGIININPYQHFSGAIQTYNVSCTQCQNLSLTNIITNNYFYYYNATLQSTSYIYNEIQYIYNLNIDCLFLYTYNMSNQLNSRNVSQNITVISEYASLYSNPLLLFLEFQTNSITWLINYKKILYICTVINGTQQNMTVPGFNSTNTAQFAVYNEGILQIITQQYNYSCYYYYLNNQTMQLVPILSNVFVSAFSYQSAYGFLQVFISEDNYSFGMYYLDIYGTLQFILLDLSTNNSEFKLNGYVQFPLEEIVSFQKDFQFQYIQQYGSPLQENYTSFVYLAYTTTIDSGILELEFLGLNLVQFQQVCSIFIINSTLFNNYLNVLSLYDNQIAIMNIPQNDLNSNLTLSLYLIDFDQCQSVQPYSFQILGTFNNSVLELNGVSLNYLNSNQLLLSLKGYTYVIEVNQLLQINYQTIANSTIILTAQNPFYSQNESIQITFTPYIIPNNSNTDNNNTSNNSNNTNNNTTSHELQWYWILLITIGSLLIIGGIFILLYYKLKNGDESNNNYSKFSGKNEIEIKDQKGNISGF